MVSKKVVASLLLVYVVSMLAEQTEGFVPFFTQSDFQKMQIYGGEISLPKAASPPQSAHSNQSNHMEKERNRGAQKKSLTSPQQLEEEAFSQQSGVDVHKAKNIQLAVPVRAGMWLTPKQLEKYQDVLKKLLAEMSQDTPDAD